jgi:hypothetical protein
MSQNLSLENIKTRECSGVQNCYRYNQGRIIHKAYLKKCKGLRGKMELAIVKKEEVGVYKTQKRAIEYL